ncbi:hypothetical protein E2562_034604 [Oryza meyeriana var. granulata]|uniref:Uncharacterized protein n=1 Tax=Oryza meyeriana var. granulata TaxID=110450 RepID=A0A6G1DRW7_9ORYZ|nr:hypothetical protein E2562_034604 [Oryza meyeriana var. granulata]
MGEEAVVMEAPRPKSPPRYPDLCGRRRMQLEVQILNREITFLKNPTRITTSTNERKGGTDPAVFFGGSDRNCASAFHVFAAAASAHPSAKEQGASIVPAARAATSHGVGQTAVRAVRGLAVVQTAARAVVQTAVVARPLHAANQTARAPVQVAAHVAVHRAANQAAAASRSLRASNLCAAASRSLHASNPSATALAQIAAPAPFQAAVARAVAVQAAVATAVAFQAAAATAAARALAANANRVVACVPPIAATASQAAAAAATGSAAAARTAAPARALVAPAASTSSNAHAPAAAQTCASAPVRRSASTASHRAARDSLRAASASHLAARGSLPAAKETAAAFQNSLALNVPVGVSGLARIVQRVVDALGVCYFGQSSPLGRDISARHVGPPLPSSHAFPDDSVKTPQVSLLLDLRRRIGDGAGEGSGRSRRVTLAGAPLGVLLPRLRPGGAPQGGPGCLQDGIKQMKVTDLSPFRIELNKGNFCNFVLTAPIIDL